MSKRVFQKHGLTLTSIAILTGLFMANGSLVQAQEASTEPPATTVPNLSDENNEVAFHIDDIVEGSTVITGTAPFNGSVYAFVNGQIATEKAEIIDGKFELAFLPDEEGKRHFLKTDLVSLSFLIDGKPSFVTYHDVTPTDEVGREEKKDNTLYIPDLTSTETTFSGTGPADHQILLYHYDSWAFVQEALIDENGNYAFNLPNLVSGDKYLLLHRTPSNEYSNILLLTVDQENFTIVGKPYYQLVLKQLGLQDHSNWSDDDDIALGVGLTKDTNAIFGYTKHQSKTAIYITSSNPEKVFPLVPIDTLGYWGINLTELDWALEVGEELTFSVVNTETGQVYGQVSDTVTNTNDGLELEDYAFDVEDLVAGATSLQGQVAPNLTIVLYDGKSDEPLAKVTSNDKGFFKITLTKPLVSEEVFYLSAFDDKGTQIAWKALNVEEHDDNEVEENDSNNAGVTKDNTDNQASETEKTKQDETVTTDGESDATPVQPENPATPIVTIEKEDTVIPNTTVTETSEITKDQTTTPSVPEVPTEMEEVEVDEVTPGKPDQPESSAITPEKKDTDTTSTTVTETKPDNNTEVAEKPNLEPEQTGTAIQNNQESKQEEIDPIPVQPVTPTENTITTPKTSTPDNHSDNGQESQHNKNDWTNSVISSHQDTKTQATIPSKQSDDNKAPTTPSMKVMPIEKNPQKTLPKTSDSRSLLALTLGLLILLITPFKLWKRK